MTLLLYVLGSGFALFCVAVLWDCVRQVYWMVRLAQANRKHRQARRRVVEVFNESGQDGEWVAALMDEIQEKKIAEANRLLEEFKQEGHDAREVNQFIRELVAKNTAKNSI